MEIRRKMINQRYMTVSPRGFNSNSVSPRGFNCLSVSPNGFNSFLIALMLMISLPIFSQTEGKYEVVISKGAKINFSNGFNVTKTQLYPGFRMYDITPVFPFFINNANNGLSISGSNVQLGGTLVQATNINQNGFNFSTNGVGNFGIGTSTPLQKLHVNGAVQFQNALMPNGNAGLAGQVLVSQGAATVPVWQTLSSGWGLLGNAGTVQSTNFLGTTDNIGLSFRTNNAIRQTITNTGEIGIGTITPTSTLHVIGSVAETVTVITATTSLNATHNKIVLNNGAANIVITLPDALTCIGRKYEFTRYAGSTGSVTVVGTGSQIQALAGTVGAITTLGAHGATGQGLKHSFTAVNIGGVGVWVRL